MFEINDTHSMARRRFLAIAGSSLGAAFLAACGAAPRETATSKATSAPGSGGSAATGTTAPSSATATGKAVTAEKGQVLVTDVIDHALRSDRWKGDFGFVTFKMHTAVVGGQPAYYIRTDASDQDFARREGLVFVPRLQGALGKNAYANLYQFEGGAANQQTVLSTAPHLADYTPIYSVNRVTFRGAPKLLNSADEVKRAEASNEVTVQATSVLVNYPVVKWPGGEMPNDQKREAYLGDGQLIDAPDVANTRVTFKLHSCYPNSRYIVTDVSMPPMAEGMKIAPAPAAAALTDAGATAQILVFGNGVKGSGPMGFQKSVTDTVAGDAAWSPMWDHFTFVWPEGANAAVLKTNAEVIERERSANLRRFRGTPDTNGQLFVVNCPVPVTAPVA